MEGIYHLQLKHLNEAVVILLANIMRTPTSSHWRKEFSSYKSGRTTLPGLHARQQHDSDHTSICTSFDDAWLRVFVYGSGTI